VRVLHVAPIPFGAGGVLGGGERYPLELARAMAGGVEAELLTFAARPGRGRDPSGLRLTTLRAVHWLGGDPAHPLAPGLPRRIAGADIVHVHQMRSLPGRMAALAALPLRRRTAVTDHGTRGGDWGGRLQRLFDRFLLVSRFSAEELKVPAERTRVIYGGADPERFQPDPRPRRDAFLFVGRLTPHKGIDVLLRALPAGATLLVAGTPGYDPKLPERDYPSLLAGLAEGKQVRFLGAVGDQELAELYRHAAALVLPTVELTCYGKAVHAPELLGLVALEAMASGTPVVCSRTGALPEIVREGETGFLLEPGSVEQLRERLRQLLGDRALIERVGSGGREAVLERFSWKTCAQRCLDAYSELFSDSGRVSAAPRA
jgi:glycosyltransferase involved in cell wall biosynthesis